MRALSIDDATNLGIEFFLILVVEDTKMSTDNFLQDQSSGSTEPN